MPALNANRLTITSSLDTAPLPIHADIATGAAEHVVSLNCVFIERPRNLMLQILNSARGDRGLLHGSDLPAGVVVTWVAPGTYPNLNSAMQKPHHIKILMQINCLYFCTDMVHGFRVTIPHSSESDMSSIEIDSLALAERPKKSGMGR